MVLNRIKRHLFLLSVFAIIFFVAGNIGLYAESVFTDLTSSTTVFGASFAGLVAGAAKIYNYLFIH